MKCIIIGSDKRSTTTIEYFVSQLTALSLLFSCTKMDDALQFLSEKEIDVIFLESGKGGGLDGVRSIRDANHTQQQLIVIAHSPDYAKEAFDLDITDYIMRPLAWERFLLTVTKLQRSHNNTQIRTDRNEMLFIKETSRMMKISFNDILYIQAVGDYMAIQTASKKYIVHQTMKELSKKLPYDIFMRVHQSYIINLDKISYIEDNSVSIDQKLIHVGRTYKKELMNRLKFL